jgi:transcriptional regulator with XRE-family HTH domain
MSTPEDERLLHLGVQLRAARHRRDLTLAELSAAADVTPGFLSLLERGKKSVTVPTLLRICGALEIQIADVFEYPDEEEVIRGGDGGLLEMGGDRVIEFLLTPASERHMNVMRTVLEPQGGSGGAYHLDCDAIFVLVIRGVLELNVGGRNYRLEQGDCTTFPGRTPHTWRNPGDTEGEVIWVLAPALPESAAPTALTSLG